MTKETLEREIMPFDVVIVGAGPAGLSAAIRLAQLSKTLDNPLSICVLEKGSVVGAHILSGAVLDPSALNELIPDWQTRQSPVKTEAKADHFYFLNEKRAFKLPTPPLMHNAGNYIISLGEFCRWLAKEAEQLGVEIFPGFPAQSLHFEAGKVAGVITGDQGLDANGHSTNNFEPGIIIKAKVTLLSEGCRGSLTKQVATKYNLHADRDPQTYAIGLKELWEISPDQHQLGKIIHTVGWPLDRHTYGGSFVYHGEANQLAIGLVVGLDYQNPYLNPFEELQRLKRHPLINPLLKDAKRISYGARALNEGGWQSIPQLHFPGGLLMGCSAGFVNVAKIKGIHNAMKSGMLAAEATVDAFREQQFDSLDYTPALHNSWVAKELKSVRNIRPAFRAGLFLGLAYAALDTYIFRGKTPWTFHHHHDHLSFKDAKFFEPIAYPKPDGKITFDKLSSVFLSNTSHRENQPCHLQLGDPTLAIDVNYRLYRSPEQRYCPAGVYEIIDGSDGPKLQINSQNCIHCKTCDILDPKQNITWVPPEGMGGPNYPNM